MFGPVMGLVCSFCVATQFITTKKLGVLVPFLHMMVGQTAAAFLICLVISFCMEGTTVTWSDPNSMWLIFQSWSVQIGTALMAGLIMVYLAMYAAAMKTVPTIVLSSSLSVEPIVSSFLSVSSHQSPMPNPLLIVGCLILFGSSLTLAVSAELKQMQTHKAVTTTEMSIAAPIEDVEKPSPPSAPPSGTALENV
eukprot:NODE_583_length_1519_cov_217.210204_g439_i0.p1 GENE.NODE_583_length_1519_cov_217.210204_g439_i0~~NODE_583_length_1519_cov_217.210204_g439_i0.p1  ORF type:complete len:194 (+),score=31.37 NODE_583_length_1519_cov_217.210204_g439_i0:504-1085(+)